MKGLIYFTPSMTREVLKISGGRSPADDFSLFCVSTLFKKNVKASSIACFSVILTLTHFPSDPLTLYPNPVRVSGHTTAEMCTAQ